MTFPFLAEWQLEAVRLIFLSNVPVSGAQKNWWHMAIGSDPASIASRPAQMEHQEAGSFDGAELVMTTRFNHVEWALRPQPSAPVSNELMNVGSGEAALHRIDEPMLRWARESKFPFQRIAFAPIFFRPADDLLQASRVATSYFPGFSGRDVEDFFGQFNIAKMSETISGVKINRIMKIGAGQVQTFTIGPTPAPVVESKYVTRIELDFNTAVDRREPISIDVLPSLLAEIQKEAAKVVSRGLL